jgi:hypothetical protein
MLAISDIEPEQVGWEIGFEIDHSYYGGISTWYLKTPNDLNSITLDDTKKLYVRAVS